MASSPVEAVVKTFLTKERNWKSITSFSSTSTTSLSLPLFHGVPDKRVYISPDDQKRFIRASTSLNAELKKLDATKDASLAVREKAIKQQLAMLESYYNAPRGEFVVSVPMHPTLVSGSQSSQGKTPIDYISGDVLAATFDEIRRVKDTVPSTIRAEDKAAAEQVLWEKGREQGESQPPVEPPLRLLLAVVDTDSTIGFYFTHDGLVPPRQN